MIYLQTTIYKKYLVVWFILLSTTLIGQNTNYTFKHFTTKDGLPHNYINNIYEDSDGFIWLATRDDVCRYDGHTFKTYNTILPGNRKIPSYSKTIFEDTNGKIWVFGPSSYSYYLDGNDFKESSLDFEFAYPDNLGNLWFINDSSLIKVDINNLMLSPNKSITNNSLSLLCKEQNDKIWAFDKFSENEFSKASSNNYITYLLKKIIDVNSVYIDSKNTIWVSTIKNGLISFNPTKEEYTHYTYNKNTNNGLLSNEVFSVLEVDKTTMWIATSQGINILNINKNTFSYINQTNSKLADNKVTSIFINSTQNIFVGTRFGLNTLSKQNFHHFCKDNEDNCILHNNVHGFVEDDLHNIWIISSDGLNKYDKTNHKFTSYPINTNKSNCLKASPISIITDKTNNFWIGTWQGGLYYYNQKTNRYKQYNVSSDASKVSHNSVMSMFCDANNDVWIGSWGKGLFKYDKTNDGIYNINYNTNFDLPKNETSAITQDTKGRYWVGTMHGLYMYNSDMLNPKIFIHRAGDSTSLSHAHVNTLHINDSMLWVGTSYGLNRINLKTFNIDMFYDTDGLPSNKILAITVDNDGDLWVTTKKGLAKIVINQGSTNQALIQIFAISSSDKLQSDTFLKRAIFKTKSGNILLGGTNGFNMFNPKDITIDTNAIKCVLTKLTVDDNEITVGDSLFNRPVISQHLTKSKSITLLYKHNTFSLEFSGLHFSNPKDIKYKYMLKGFDEDWRYTNSKNRAVTYSNINKGKYEFIAYATQNNAQWGNNPLSIHIKIIPPWWRTALFYIGLGLLIVMIFIAFYKLRINVLKRQKEQLEDTVKERTLQLSETNTNLEESHEEIRQQNEILAETNSNLEETKEEVNQQNNELVKHRNNLEDMIIERTSELTIAKQNAEESDKLKSAFLANMSHEIRTPLNAIVGFSSLIKDGNLSKKEIEEFVDIITENSNSLTSIVNNIIDISIIEAKQLKLTISDFTVDEILFDIIEDYKLENKNNLSIEFIKDVKIINPTIHADKSRFKQVIDNLIGNALKYTTKGYVKIGYNAYDGNVIFFVEDSGMGIAEEDKNIIFKYFSKGLSVNNEFNSGTGLGLTISQELVTKMGGKIWFESKKDIGTKFAFSLPLKKEL